MAYAAVMTARASSGKLRLVKGPRCTRCGGRKRDSTLRWCEFCRDVSAASLFAWREGQRAVGRCTHCVERKKQGTYWPGFHYVNCDYHVAHARETNKARYDAKRAKGLCVYGACKVRTSGIHCDEHREQSNAWQRSSRKVRSNHHRRAA